MEVKANIFDIQGLSVHDGPGCRTVIFMQGCTLNCAWCSNPEGISRSPEILYDVSKCRLDGACIADCKLDAIKITENKLIIDRNICQTCVEYTCLNNCYTNALSISSKEMDISEVMKIIKRDRQFWGKDGGLTLSGGEPLLQIDFAEQILKKSYDAYIHTAIETCGSVAWQNYERVLPYLDWIFYDIKNIDSNLHKNLTGSENKLILSNISRLAKEFKGRLIVRFPVIPNFNTNIDLINKYITFFNDNNISEVNLLPLHHLGREKYQMLQRDYKMNTDNIPTRENMFEIADLFKNANIKCYIGSATPF